MKKHLAWLVLLLLPGTAFAYNYPTIDRVEFVLQCMEEHPGKFEYLYKCSCVIDSIAKKLKYDDYVEFYTASRGQRTGGEAGGIFRDPPEIKKMAKRYDEIKAKAGKECFIQ